MRFDLRVDEQTGEAEIKRYDTGEAFQRGYEMGEAYGRKSANDTKVELYRRALNELAGMGDIDRKAVTGYISLEAIISRYDAEELLEVMDDRRKGATAENE